MDFELVWTERAVTSFEDALRHVAADDPAAAGRLRVEVLDAVGVLARLPFIGPSWDRDRARRVREIYSRPCRVFYRVDEPARRVEVLLVWHAARREPRV